MLYIIINKETNEVSIHRTKTQVANRLNLHRNTISNKINNSSVWDTPKFTLYKTYDVETKSDAGLKKGQGGFNFK